MTRLLSSANNDDNNDNKKKDPIVHITNTSSRGGGRCYFLVLLLLLIAPTVLPFTTQQDASATTSTAEAVSQPHHLVVDDDDDDCPVEITDGVGFGDFDDDDGNSSSSRINQQQEHEQANHHHHHQQQQQQQQQQKHPRPQQQCKARILNESGSSMDLYWIDPTTGEAFSMNERGMRTAAHGDLMTLETYTNHVFEARRNRVVLEEDDKEEGSQSNSVRFQIPPPPPPPPTNDDDDDNDETIINLAITEQMQILWNNEHDISIIPATPQSDFSNNHDDINHNSADGGGASFSEHKQEEEEEEVQEEAKLTMLIRQLVQFCQKQAATADNNGIGSNAPPPPTTTTTIIMARIKECMEDYLGLWISKVQNDLQAEKSLRQRIGERLEEYSCNDDSLETTQPQRIEQWTPTTMETETTTTTDRSTTRSHDVWILLDRPASKIHLVHDFVTPEECRAMEQAAIHKLEEGMVADGSGSVVRANSRRKAKQAWITVPPPTNDGRHPITQLSDRIYQYVNHVLIPNLNTTITREGQEDIMSIQYKGKRQVDGSIYDDDEPPDQYKPHCDGICDGQRHQKGTRMATMVMYCTLPTKGGHTNFQYSNVHIKPQRNAAIFFSYMDPSTQTMDDGFTEHSGCPVYEGNKTIVTQWIRYGVNATHPHSQFPHLF